MIKVARLKPASLLVWITYYLMALKIYSWAKCFLKHKWLGGEENKSFAEVCCLWCGSGATFLPLVLEMVHLPVQCKFSNCATWSAVASRRKCGGKNIHLLMLICVLSLGLACFWKFYMCLWDLCPALRENHHRRQTPFFNPRTTGDVLAEGISSPG